MIIEPIWIFAFFPAVFALIFLTYAVLALRKKKVFGGISRLLIGSLFLTVAALAGLISLGTFGYKSLTQEQLAATVDITSRGPQRFNATFNYDNGQQESYELAGDQLYVDARVISWHPAANFFGLRTIYALERVSGRYEVLDDEQSQLRTVHSLGPGQLVDIALLESIGPLSEYVSIDAYGSGTFTPIEDGGRYEVRVSRSGLLIRKLN